MKKLFYIVCLVTMFMFIGEVKADTQYKKCLYKIPAGVLNEEETKIELSNNNGSNILDTLYFSGNRKINLGDKPLVGTWTFELLDGNKCPSITLDIPKKLATPAVYPSQKACLDVQQIGKDSCKSTVYKGTYSHNNISAGNATGRQNAKLMTESSNSTQCWYQNKNNVLIVKNNQKVSCKISAGTATMKCEASINDTVYKKFTQGGTFTCPSFIYYDMAGGGGTNVMVYKYKITSVGSPNEVDNSNSDEFIKPDGFDFEASGGSDEWLTDPDKMPEAEKINPCEIISKDNSLYKIMKQIINYLQIGTIFIVILLSGLDFISAITSGDDDVMKKATSKTSKRIIALVLVFLVPAIVNLLLSIVNVGACGSKSDLVSELFK